MPERVSVERKLPANPMAIPCQLGVPETIKEGSDITMVSYGSTLRIVREAAEMLEKRISCEVIDVQTLLFPFDINHHIVASLKKPTALYSLMKMFPEALRPICSQRWKKQGDTALDAAPYDNGQAPHRPAYGSDGDYFSKPNTEDIIAVVNEMMAE